MCMLIYGLQPVTNFRSLLTHKGAQAVVMQYHARHAQDRSLTTVNSNAPRSFSHEAFVDALIQLFVADDLVSS